MLLGNRKTAMAAAHGPDARTGMGPWQRAGSAGRQLSPPGDVARRLTVKYSPCSARRRESKAALGVARKPATRGGAKIRGGDVADTARAGCRTWATRAAHPARRRSDAREFRRAIGVQPRRAQPVHAPVSPGGSTGSGSRWPSYFLWLAMYSFAKVTSAGLFRPIASASVRARSMAHPSWSTRLIIHTPPTRLADPQWMNTG